VKWQAWSAVKAEELGKRSVVNETTVVEDVDGRLGEGEEAEGS
jgi:hypothetical protein